MKVDDRSHKESLKIEDVKPVYLGVGQTFGELSLINEQKRTSRIQTQSDCHFAVLGKEDYSKVLYGDDALAL